MKKQTGFTLIEIAIVLVIIGLLLGGVLKGQELINGARVKNLATDFRTVPVFIYGYQDKYRRLPGDDPAADTHVGGTPATTPSGDGDGVIEGQWNSVTETDESIRFWQHVRLAGFAPGSTATPTSANVNDFLPRNALGGKVGVSSSSPITSHTGGSYFVCSEAISGVFAKQLDVTFDDGETSTGSMRIRTAGAAAAVQTTNVIDSDAYVVCLGI